MAEDYGAQANRLTDLVQRVLDSGGFSVNSKLEDAPDSGYYVGTAGGDEIPVEVFTPANIMEWKDKVGPDYIGAWLSDGIVYLDHSVRFDNEADAMQFGIDNQQQAIWDANTGTEIPVVESPWPFRNDSDELNARASRLMEDQLKPKTSATNPSKFVTTKEQHLHSLKTHGPVKPHHHAN